MAYIPHNILAKGDDAFFQLLLFAVIIGFSIIKSITKAIGNKLDDKNDSKSDEYQAKPKRQANYVNSDGSYKTLKQLKQDYAEQIRSSQLGKSFAQSQSVHKFTPAVSPVAKHPSAVEHKQQSSHSNREEQIIHQQQMFQKYISSISSAKQKQRNPAKPHRFDRKAKKQDVITAETEEIKTVDTGKMHLRFDTNNLRKAIIFKEILSKPISLR